RPPFQPGAVPPIDAVANFFDSVPNSLVRSETSAGAAIGLRCSARHHGGFPTDPQTLESVCYLLRTGAFDDRKRAASTGTTVDPSAAPVHAPIEKSRDRTWPDQTGRTPVPD